MLFSPELGDHSQPSTHAGKQQTWREENLNALRQCRKGKLQQHRTPL